MKIKIICLVIGILITVLGFIQFWRYENNSITVEATVTEIRTREDTDSDNTGDRYSHVYYGEYTIDGKKYDKVHLKTEHSNDMMPKNHKGDEIEIVVDSSNPGRKMAEGGIFNLICNLIVQLCLL